MPVIANRAHAGRWLAAGVVVVAVSIVGLERVSETSFTWHMVQHTLLIVVAAPLLALGAPAVLRRLPDSWQRIAASIAGPGWVAWMVVALALQAAAMVLWHLPPAFEAAVENDALHGAEHITMLATAVFFWWVVFSAGSSRVAVSIVALFLTTGVCSALGAGLTLAGHTWYPAYRSINDQAMGGVIMWAVVGTAYLIAAVVLFFGWLARLERASPGGLVTSP
jgi:cytochrome c oxidase assembly factor CtaG